MRRQIFSSTMRPRNVAIPVFVDLCHATHAIDRFSTKDDQHLVLAVPHFCNDGISKNEFTIVKLSLLPIARVHKMKWYANLSDRRLLPPPRPLPYAIAISPSDLNFNWPHVQSFYHISALYCCIVIKSLHDYTPVQTQPSLHRIFPPGSKISTGISRDPC